MRGMTSVLSYHFCAQKLLTAVSKNIPKASNAVTRVRISWAQDCDCSKACGIHKGEELQQGPRARSARSADVHSQIRHMNEQSAWELPLVLTPFRLFWNSTGSLDKSTSTGIPRATRVGGWCLHVRSCLPVSLFQKQLSPQWAMHMSTRRFLYVHLSCPRNALPVPCVLPREKALLSPAAISEGSEDCISCGSSCCKPNKQILSASHKSAASHNLYGINILGSPQLWVEHFGSFPCSSADSQKRKNLFMSLFKGSVFSITIQPCLSKMTQNEYPILHILPFYT